ncbi:MAG TPA: winged helix-turn-helix domain-containing protein [Mycobacteriales bacterium]|nr:winged helix-turn-helix domain-containing protein [Mycobacteriales bacterium]
MSRPHPPDLEGGSPVVGSALLALADPATVGPLAEAMQRNGLVSLLAFDANQVLARLSDQPLDVSVILLDTRLVAGNIDQAVAAIRRLTQADILTLHPSSGATGPGAGAAVDALPLGTPVASIAARAHTLARAHRGNGPHRLLRWGELRLDRTTQAAYIGRDPLRLTPSQFAALGRLVDADGAVVRIDQIADAIYGRGHPLDSQRVRAHIVRLRRAMRAVRPQVAELLVTVRSHGYRMMPPATPAEDAGRDQPARR